MIMGPGLHLGVWRGRKLMEETDMPDRSGSKEPLLQRLDGDYRYW